MTKLVRDNIPKIMQGQGNSPKFHAADDSEYWRRLKEKLDEEVAEFQAAESLEELADVLEVLDAIAEFKAFKPEDIQTTKNTKAGVKGKFKQRLVLED